MDMRRPRGAGAPEGLVVLAILLVIVGIAVPHLPRRSDKEARLRKNLTFCRAAIQIFYDDTKLYPDSIADLAATSPPDTGRNAKGEEEELTNWHGPYLHFVPNDPVSGKLLLYRTSPPNVGAVSPSATGTASNGTLYKNW